MVKINIDLLNEIPVSPRKLNVDLRLNLAAKFNHFTVDGNGHIVREDENNG